MGDNGLNAGTITAIGGAVALVVSAIAVAFSKIVTALKDAKIDMMHASEMRKVETDKKLADITSHVNGASSAMTTKIENLERALTSVTGQLAEQKQVAAVLAQSQSNKLPAASVEAPTPVIVVDAAKPLPVKVIGKK